MTSHLLAQGAAGTGDIINAVKHVRTIAQEVHFRVVDQSSIEFIVCGQIANLKGLNDQQLVDVAASLRVPVALVKETQELGRLPVVNFAAGGVATPADAALMMQLGCDGVFVGSVCKDDSQE